MIDTVSKKQGKPVSSMRTFA